MDLSKIQRCVVKKVDQYNDGSKLIEVSLFGNSNSRASCTVKDSWFVCLNFNYSFCVKIIIIIYFSSGHGRAVFAREAL